MAGPFAGTRRASGLFLALLLAAGCDNGAAERLRTCAGGNTQKCYEDGMAALDAAKPRFGDARKAFAAACRPSVTPSGAESSISQHRPAACNELAMLVRDAKGGPKDTPRAIDLFGIACKDGIETACVDWADLLYSDDPERAEDANRAVVLFDQACGKVDLAALPEDDKQAPPLAVACAALGRAYEAGAGVEPPKADKDKAAEMYDKACRARVPLGCVLGGNLLVATKQQSKIVDASKLYEQACRFDPHFGCFELGALHEKGGWPGADDALAVKFYQRICTNDPSRGCFEAGALLEEGRVPSKEGEIDALYNRACEHGNSVACSRRAMRR